MRDALAPADDLVRDMFQQTLRVSKNSSTKVAKGLWAKINVGPVKGNRFNK